MIKLIALYKKPEDVDAFEKHFHEVHVPLIKKVPHMRNFVTNKSFGAPRGEPRAYRISEMWFDDRESFDKAMASEENRAAGRDLQTFAHGMVAVVFAETEETGEAAAAPTSAASVASPAGVEA